VVIASEDVKKSLGARRAWLIRELGSMRKHSSEDTKDKAQASKNFAEIGVAGAARGDKIESLWKGTSGKATEMCCTNSVVDIDQARRCV